jgi:hypothetical protein
MLSWGDEESSREVAQCTVLVSAAGTKQPAVAGCSLPAVAGGTGAASFSQQLLSCERAPR